jgi:hypothetical protein
MKNAKVYVVTTPSGAVHVRTRLPKRWYKTHEGHTVTPATMSWNAVWRAAKLTTNGAS